MCQKRINWLYSVIFTQFQPTATFIFDSDQIVHFRTYSVQNHQIRQKNFENPRDYIYFRHMLFRFNAFIIKNRINLNEN